MGKPRRTPPQGIPQQPPDDVKNPELFTCEICIEPKPLADKKFRSGDNRCSHPFCTSCVVKYIRAKLENDNVGRIKCPDLSCDRTLHPRACESLVGPSLFVRWCDVLCEEAIADLDRCYCPYAKCRALIVNECSEIARKSKCPECRRRFCFECKKAWHAGFVCRENTETRDRDDVAFRRLVEARKWMRCPQCRHFVDLKCGCQFIKCRCGIMFCYGCGKQVYQHLCDCVEARIEIGTEAGTEKERCGRCMLYCLLFCLFLLVVGLTTLLLIWLLPRHLHKS